MQTGGWWSSPTAWLLNERGSFIASPNQRAQPWAQTRADPRWWEGDVRQGDVLVVAGSFPWAADVGCPKGRDLAKHLLFPIENKSRFSNTQTEPYLLLCHLQPPCARFCACRWVERPFPTSCGGHTAQPGAEKRLGGSQASPPCTPRARGPRDPEVGAHSTYCQNFLPSRLSSSLFGPLIPQGWVTAGFAAVLPRFSDRPPA